MPRKTNKRTPKRKISRKLSKGKRVSRKGKNTTPKKVKEILSSTYGIAGLMKVDEKGYKAQRVAKKDPYKNKKPKHPPIPSNIKGKKKKKKLSKTKTLPSMQSEMDSFLAGIDSKPSKKKGSWIEHVKAHWEERRKTEPGYKYKDAMKDAKKTW
tara:strand:- start:2189 stop:2650 length:462 start_codon:yes stop_codon:yes gene_type:complete